jgi:hypothetical protein
MKKIIVTARKENLEKIEPMLKDLYLFKMRRMTWSRLPFISTIRGLMI